MTDTTAEEPKSSRSPKQAAEMRSPDEWAAQKNPIDWALAGAKFAMRDTWVIGRLIAEADFDAAIKAVVELPFSSPTQLRKPRTKRGRR